MIERLMKESTIVTKAMWIILIVSFFIIWINQSIVISVCCATDLVLIMIIFHKAGYLQKSEEKSKISWKVVMCCLMWGGVLCFVLFSIMKISADTIVKKYLFYLFSVPILAVPAVFLPCNRVNRSIYNFGILYFSFGLFLVGVMPVGSVPDEAMHSFTAYRLSNRILGVEKRENGNIAMREQDIDYQMFPYVNMETYSSFLIDLETKQSNNDIYYIELPCVEGSDYAYIIPAVGISIGRILQVNTETMYLLARIMNLLFSTIGIMYILTKLPVGRNVLCVLMFTPVMMQQMSSISYDIPVNLSLLFLVTFSLLWFYKREDITRLDWLFMAISCYVGIQAKSHAYFLIALLPLLMYFGRILADHKKACFLSLLALLICIIMIFIIAKKIPMISLTADDSYSILFLIQNPEEIIRIFIRTVNTYGVWMVFSVIGNYLSYLNLVIHPLLIIFLGVILIVSTVNGSSLTQLKKSDKVVIMLIAVFESVIVCVGMLLANSHYGDHMVLGLQGRYFIIMLLMICLTIPSWKRVRLNQRNISFCHSLLMILIFVNIVHVY